MKKLTFAMSFALIAWGQGAGAEGLRFEIGGTIGFSSAEISGAIGNQAYSFDMSGASFGVVARTTWDISDTQFAGIHMGVQKESASYSLSGGGVTAEVSVDYTADILARIGLTRESVSPYLAGGWSFASATGKVSDSGASVTLTDTYDGPKLAAGVDFGSSFVQLEYATYDTNLEDIDAVSVRFGIMHKF